MSHFPLHFTPKTSNLLPSTRTTPTTLIPAFLSRNIFLHSVDWHCRRNHMKVTLQEVISFNKHNYSTRNLTTNYLSIGFLLHLFFWVPRTSFELLEKKNVLPALTIAFFVTKGFITLRRGLIEDFMKIDWYERVQRETKPQAFDVDRVEWKNLSQIIDYKHVLCTVKLSVMFYYF